MSVLGAVWDVVVVGGGHAGSEAAAAAARIGARVALVTHDRQTVGVMSCNPAIGGVGKGHLVREVDALDGLMARAIDRAGLQFRVLNRRKGPAVWGPRAQADREAYRKAILEALEALQPALQLIAAEVVDLVLDGGAVVGVALADGTTLRTGAVVLTTGTFLGGVIHRGEERFVAGRLGDAASLPLASRLRALGLPVGRLKTGTPPRLDGRTIDWSAVERQEGDSDPEPLSFLTPRIATPQRACGITRTTAATHAIVRAHLSSSAVHGGRIDGVGPRYCPSIEDKVVRFGDREAHQIFLEPEGWDDPTVYPNGISTSLAPAAQDALVRSIPGLERAAILRYGYAIEYDYLDPRGLEHSLESRALPRLFLAGQINGTTGYEEAAAQGLLAGVNAARRAAGMPAVSLCRSQGYMGVMVDDLVTRGVTEPYRMFTSRAEYRLALRADNADRRLTPLGLQWGCVAAPRRDAFAAREEATARAMVLLERITVSPTEAQARGLPVNADGQRRSGFDLLALPGVTMATLAALWPELQAIDSAAARRIEIDARYHVYLERQDETAQRLLRDEALSLQSLGDFASIRGLSAEVRQKLAAVQPRSLGQARRMEGMTPAALALLAIHARRAADTAAADRDVA